LERFELSTCTSVWNANCPVSYFGDSIFVHVNDIAGRTASDSIIINQFDTPTVEIVMPSVNAFTICTVDRITISGTYTELDYNDSITLYFADTASGGIFSKIGDTIAGRVPADTWMFSGLPLATEYPA